MNANFENWKKKYNERRNNFLKNEQSNSMYTSNFATSEFNKVIRNGGANANKLKYIKNLDPGNINNNFLGTKLSRAIENGNSNLAVTLLNMNAPMKNKNLLKKSTEKGMSNKVINELKKKNNNIIKADINRLVNRVNRMTSEELKNKLPRMSANNKNLIKKHINRFTGNKKTFINKYINL